MKLISRNILLYSILGTEKIFIRDRRLLGTKEYQAKDHLGNVRLTFSDRKTPANLTSYAPYTLEVRSLNNYYSYGSLQSGQSYESGKSRYGFNGMEMDNELGITGKNYTTEFREFDTDIGRWWSPDPKPTASESWYVAMGNNPILFTDISGDSIFATQEGFNIANEGFKATLGDKSPFYYNSEAGKIEANSYNPADFSDKQNEIINRTVALIDVQIPIKILPVNSNEDFTDTKLETTTLDKLVASGACIRRFNDDNDPTKITSIELYIDRSQTSTLKTKNGLEYENNSPRGLIWFHEGTGHAFLFLTNNLFDESHNKKVNEFENTIRGIYKTGKYGIEGIFNLKLPGSNKYLNGKAVPHDDKKVDKKRNK